MAKKSKKKARYGLNVIGNTRIYCVEREIKVGSTISVTRSYWTNLLRKTEEDEWLSKSIPVYFSKDLELPEHNSTIGLIDSRLFLVGNDDNLRIALYVEDYEEVE